MKKLLLSMLAVFLLFGCSIGEGHNPGKETAGGQKPSGKTDEGSGKADGGGKSQPVSNSGNGSGQKDNSGIGKDSTDGSGSTPSNPGTGKTEATQTAADTKSYFPKANQVKTFKGTGNEFASEVETIYSKEGEYLATVSANGGTRILRIYQLSNNGIYLVYEEPEFYSEEPPVIEAYKSSFTPKLVMPEKVKVGQKFSGWTVKQIGAQVTVPYGKISNAILLEKAGSDGSIVQNFWAPSLGIVKKTFYQKDASGNETMVETELEKVDVTS